MCLSLDQTCYLAVMGSLMLGWISSYVFSAFQFCVILWDSGVEVLSRHPCFVGSYYFKAIVKFLSYYSSWVQQHITPFPNQVQLKFPSTSNLSVHGEGKMPHNHSQSEHILWRLHSGESVWWKGMHTIHFKGLEIVRQFQMKKEWLIGWTDYIIVHCSKSVWLHGKRSYFSRL